MPWSELRLITPGMFLALEKQRSDKAKDDLFGFRFLATWVVRTAMNGNPEADFMEDVGSRPLMDLDETEGYFKALAEAAERSGKSGKHSTEEPQGTPESHEVHGNVHRAEGR